MGHTFTYVCHRESRLAPCPRPRASSTTEHSGLVISTDKYQQGRREVVLAAITSNVGRLLVGDYKIKAWRESGLLHPSIVTGIVRTITRDLIAGTMGTLPASELRSVEDKLREILALP
jgi:hypothetical protein